MSANSELPVAVVGAGPVGLAAAAHLLTRGLRPLILESGPTAGTSLRAWGHVRVFSPWRYIIDAAADQMLRETGWISPDLNGLPTGSEIVEEYLSPLARHPAIARNVIYNATVTAITRMNLDKVTSAAREEAPFQIRYKNSRGEEEAVLARAVIDASGTWTRPNPMGVDGLPTIGESDAGPRIAYGIPDVAGKDREQYAGASVLVVGSGHSAINIVLALMEVQETTRSTTIYWALRRHGMDRLVGGGLNDQLPARGDLGLAAKAAIGSGKVKLLTPFAVQAIRLIPDGLEVEAHHAGQPERLSVNRIVVATGFRPELDMLKEVRVDLDPAVEAPRLLAPMIDPNLHSCGTVPPHGVVELAHPDAGFYIVGSKSYGRAPTFLMATGYEQVRSVVAELAGDRKAAREVHLVLPETGVCNSSYPSLANDAAGGCCGGPAPAKVDACCVKDVQAKSEGKAGCGCGVAAAENASLEPAE